MEPAARRQPLTRERIVAAALWLIDTHGLDGLSMRKLGAELGVEGMAIYRHFPDKQALLQGVAEAFYADIDVEFDIEVPWRERVRRNARGLRRAMLDHPNLISLLLHTPPVKTADWLMELEAQLAAFRAGGLDPKEAIQAYYTMGSYVLGYVTVELQYARSPFGEDDEEEFVAMLESGKFPSTQDALPHFAGDWDELFDIGLDTTLAGITARYGLDSK